MLAVGQERVPAPLARQCASTRRLSPLRSGWPNICLRFGPARCSTVDVGCALGCGLAALRKQAEIQDGLWRGSMRTWIALSRPRAAMMILRRRRGCDRDRSVLNRRSDPEIVADRLSPANALILVQVDITKPQNWWHAVKGYASPAGTDMMKITIY